MDPLLIAVIILAALVVVVVVFWRQAVSAAQTRERETQAAIAEAQTKAALGEESRRLYAGAETQRNTAESRAAAAESKAAAAQADATATRTARDEAVHQCAEERKRVTELSTQLQSTDAARAAAAAELEAARANHLADTERIAVLERETAAIRADRDQAASKLAAASEQIAQLDQAQAAVATATGAADAARNSQAAAEAARATADAEAIAARALAADLTTRLQAAQADLTILHGERTSLLNRLAESESQRGAAQASRDGARVTIDDLTARLATSDKNLAGARDDLLRTTTEVQRLTGELAQAIALANERQKAQEDARAHMATELRALTTQLYEEQGKAMMGEGRQAMEQTLAPLKERLQEFQKRLDAAHETDVRERASLHTEIKNLLAAETRLSAEAEQLGRALRADTKSQGTWGELTLERLLEASQLERYLTYDLQVPVRDDEGGAGRPDAVIFLPEQKALAIDAKVSLTAFMRAINAENDDIRATSLSEHAQSVRNHMRGLAKRDYPEALKGHSLDMVLMFLPSEAAFAAAVVQDTELWSDAWKDRIIIVSPTTLLATLRVVSQIWRVEKQNRNSAAIAKEAGGILEKLRGFLNDFEDVGKALQAAHRSFDDARSKLASGKGNLVNRAQKLIRLGAPAKEETRATLAAAAGDEDDGDGTAPAVGCHAG